MWFKPKRGGTTTSALVSNRWRSGTLDPRGPQQILIDDDDFRGANKNVKRQKKEWSACGERWGPARGRDADGTDLGYGCHKRTSEETSHSSISRFLAAEASILLSQKKIACEDWHRFSHILVNLREWTGTFDVQIDYPLTLCLGAHAVVFYVMIFKRASCQIGA